MPALNVCAPEFVTRSSWAADVANIGPDLGLTLVERAGGEGGSGQQGQCQDRDQCGKRSPPRRVPGMSES